MILSKLTALQKLLPNDLREFRERFFRGMKPLPGIVSEQGEATAPGKPEPRWRVNSLDLFETWWISGIVGGRSPSLYSESPNLWNPYFRRLNIEGVFFAFDLPPDRSLLSFLHCWLRIPGVLDLTVTDPLKQEAYHALRSLPFPVIPSDQVERTQTVNHLILDEEGGCLLALNTDGLGMVRALRSRVQLEGKRILLLGAGGTAASIGAELLRCPCTLWIANRTPSRARALAESLRRSASRAGDIRLEIESSGFEKIEKLLTSTDVLINTVATGCPIDSGRAARLSPAAVLAESKYGDKAELAGLASGRIYVDGRAMLFGQFVEAAEVVRSLLDVPPDAHLRAVRSLEGRC